MEEFVKRICQLTANFKRKSINEIHARSGIPMDLKAILPDNSKGIPEISGHPQQSLQTDFPVISYTIIFDCTIVYSLVKFKTNRVRRFWIL